MPHDLDTKAKVLVDAALTTDREAADKHGVHRSTIYRWREKLDENHDLQRLTTKYWRDVRAEESWVQGATHTIRKAQAFIRDAADELDPGDPDAVRAMTDALQTLAESLQMARIVDARLGTSRQNDEPDRQDDAGRLAP
jgi:transposase-like protein